MSRPSRIPPLLAAVRGPVLFPGDDGFVEETAVFNTTVAHDPYMIIGVVDAADVRLAVRFAREEGAGEHAREVLQAYRSLTAEAPDELTSSAAAPALVDTVTTMPVAQIATIGNDPTDPATAVEHFVMLDELSPAAVETILELAGPDSDGRITLVNLTARLDGRKHPSYLSPADLSIENVRLAYDEATYERLRDAKTKWDPQNMFRWNHNISPRA